MTVESSSFRQGLQNEGADRAGEKRSHGHIGKVVNYHPNSGKKNKDGTFEGGVCSCDRHEGSKMKSHEMHTVDADVLLGNKMQRLYSVPCFVYSQGVIDKGFQKNDRVWIQYINGDSSLPVATAYYREPDQLELFWNNLKHRVAGFFDDLLPDSLS
jgi:hypothetical protein